MTAWIQIDKDGIPRTRNHYELYHGFLEIGEEVKTYHFEDLFSGKLDNITVDDIFVGTIESTNKALQILGKKVPDLTCYPDELMHLYGRKIWSSTVGKIRKDVIDPQFTATFIKPKKTKKFDGFILRNSSEVFKLDECDDTTEIWCNELIDMQSEFRFYVHNHNVIGAYRYTGDYKIAPNIDERIFLEPLYSIKKPPTFYSVDIAFLNHKDWVVIEMNDGYALGNYTLSPRKYAYACRDRWYEMVV